MKSETKNCQNCKNDFTIEPEDFAFYEKIDVPAPTFCPECRLIRRMVWRNERNLYKRTCKTADGEKEVISNYAPTVPMPVYEYDYWLSDGWDPKDYGRDYDFDRPFFEQIKDLIDRVPVPHVTNLQNTDSNYCNFTYQCKNCYLCFTSDMNEDSSYLHKTMKSKNSCDLNGCENMETCFWGFKSRGCYQSSYVYHSENCIESSLMWNCHNCTSCFGCVNLRNKSHCIFNKQYSKEEYEQEIQKYKNGSYATFQENIDRFFAFMLEFPHRYAHILQSQNVTGNHINNAKNCHYCFDITDKIEDCKFTGAAFTNTTDCYDLFTGGVNFETGYEVTCAGENAQGLFMSAMVWTSSQIYNSIFCSKSNNLFGCVGMKDAQYCILNKQYTKEEYEELLPKIKQHMKDVPYVDSKGREYRYGEFFPIELSPFAYNETIANDHYPISQNDAQEQGYGWKEKEKNAYSPTLKTSDVPDSIHDVEDSVIKEVIECADADKDYSPSAFRVTNQELQLCKQLQLPLPRKSPNARYYERFAQRLPMKLWHRQCMCDQDTHDHDDQCGNEFETAFSPDRAEIVYCEECYKREVL